MNYLAQLRIFGNRPIIVICCLIVTLVAMTGVAQAQSDNFGSLDRLYIDTVAAGPGQSVLVSFNMINDEPISSISVPVTYNPDLLTLTAVSFAGSRIDYMANKFLTPNLIDTVDGHFFVSTFTLFEEPVEPGDGLLFTATFTIAADAVIGSTVSIDTLFYPPGGRMIFVEASTAATIIPEVVSGAVVIGEKNTPPVISPLANQTVFEGDTLTMTILAEDMEKDNLILTCIDKPSGALFTDHGNGSATLRWVPSYVGPNSSDGSPFAFSFRASDGMNVTGMNLPVNVVNKNRKPILEIAPIAEYPSGTSFMLPMTVTEPDFEPLTWTINGLPNGAELTDEGLAWASKLTDTGAFPITFIAADPQGYADTASTTITLNQVALYTMKIDTAEGFPGDTVSVGVSLDNSFPVTSMNLLVYLDPTVLTVTKVDRSDTRIAGFEYFR